LGDAATTQSEGMAAAPLPCVGQIKAVRFMAIVVVVVGWVVVVVGWVVVVVVGGTVVVVEVVVDVVVVVATVLLVVVGTVVVVVEVVVDVVVVGWVVVGWVVVVVGGAVAHVGSTGEVAIAGVSFTGSRINNPLRPTARIAERRIQVGGRYFTEQT
jgi:hypothetical protein